MNNNNNKTNKNMRKYLTLIFITVIALSCNSRKTSLEEENLKGNIVKIFENTYEVEEKFGKIETGDKEYYGHYLITYNDFGNISERTTFSRNGEMERVEKLKYNENEMLIENSIYNSDNKLEYKVKFYINESNSNRFSKVEHYNEDGKLTEIYKYKYNGSLISGGDILNSSKELLKTWKNEFEGDILIKQTILDSIGNITTIQVYNRNGNNDIVHFQEFDKNDSLSYERKYTYEYDEKNNWIRQIEYVDDKPSTIKIRKILYKEDLDKEISKNDFIGIWFEIGDNDWIEFKENNKYDKGYNENIKDNGEWELDKNQKIITFRSANPDKSKKYSYKYSEFILILSTVSGDIEMQLEKR